jgi:hypothetical protein
MNEADFWNLAGRAGRWGREFSGNVVCIDPDAWDGGAPMVRGKYKIERSADKVMAGNELVEFIEGRTDRAVAAKRSDLEATASYLFAVAIRNNGSLLGARWLDRIDRSVVERLNSAISSLLPSIRVAPDVVLRNTAISPLAMNTLLDYFEQRASRIEKMLPVAPSSNDARSRYIAILSRINATLAPVFGGNERRTTQLGTLVTHWMQGQPLKRLIDSRLEYYSKKNPDI